MLTMLKLAGIRLNSAIQGLLSYMVHHRFGPPLLTVLSALNRRVCFDFRHQQLSHLFLHILCRNVHHTCLLANQWISLSSHGYLHFY